MSEFEENVNKIAKQRYTAFFTNIILFLSMVFIGCLAVKWVIG